MKIRKLFKFEGSHVVRNCTTKRCSQNIHGHSYKVELIFHSWHLDNGGMVLDFGIIKNSRIGRIIDAFDHTHLIWSGDDSHYKDFIKQHNKRWIEIPLNASAECIALILFALIKIELDKMEFDNGESGVDLDEVIVHETETGYASVYYDDLGLLDNIEGYNYPQESDGWRQMFKWVIFSDELEIDLI